MLCRACRHLLSSMRDGGHPSPCARVRWEQSHQRTPELVRRGDGVFTCPSFYPRTAVSAPNEAETGIGQTFLFSQSGVNAP